LFLYLPFLCVFCALAANAQTYLGSLTGEVSDATGAKIVGATVTATDTVTKFSTKAVTKQDGAYSIRFLQPDNYTVSASAASFESQNRTGVLLTADATLSIDFVLGVGSQAESVTVQATNVDILDRNSADLAVTLTAQEVTDLPVIGRSPYQVASLTPGMYDSAYMQSHAATGEGPGGNSGSAIIASGVGGSHTVLLLNGTYNAPRERISGTGGGYGGFVPSPESTQEVKIQTSMYDAEYGNSGGTVIDTVLRPGSNAFHGAAFYILRNTYLNANTYERAANQQGAVNPASPTPRINGTWSNPGFVFDGPVRIPHLYNGQDKTFFMVAYERFQLHGSNTSGSTDLVPDAAMASGDFSELCTGGCCIASVGVSVLGQLRLQCFFCYSVPMVRPFPPGRLARQAESHAQPGAALGTSDVLDRAFQSAEHRFLHNLHQPAPVSGVRTYSTGWANVRFLFEPQLPPIEPEGMAASLRSLILANFSHCASRWYWLDLRQLHGDPDWPGMDHINELRGNERQHHPSRQPVQPLSKWDDCDLRQFSGTFNVGRPGPQRPHR
jgi:hypothetical protein